jgi:hypothetical protein
LMLFMITGKIISLERWREILKVTLGWLHSAFDHARDDVIWRASSQADFLVSLTKNTSLALREHLTDCMKRLLNQLKHRFEQSFDSQRRNFAALTAMWHWISKLNHNIIVIDEDQNFNFLFSLAFALLMSARVHQWSHSGRAIEQVWFMMNSRGQRGTSA